MVKMWDAKNAGWKEVMNRTFEEYLKEMECGGILLVLKEDFIVEIRLDIREDEVYTMQAFHTVEIPEYLAADSVELVPVLRGCECTVVNDLCVLNRFSDVDRFKSSMVLLSRMPENVVGRIEYLHTNGKLRESVDYVNPYQLKQKIKKENYYGTPMKVILYKQADGSVIPHEFIAECDPPLQGFEIIDNPYLQQKNAN